MKVKPKKHLGQHFLTNEAIANRIAESLNTTSNVLEIGPGTGALTKYLLPTFGENLFLNEIDIESIAYLNKFFPTLTEKIITESFLNLDLDKWFSEEVAIIGNFPYNISSQILFRVHEQYEKVPVVVGMFQKEVAQRICSGAGNKTYGILSVLLQVHYHCEYLFTVHENDFDPPPKVKSGVIRLTRKEAPEYDKKFFKTVVKAAFNLRRKTLRNSLKGITGDRPLPDKFSSKRPEQLSVDEFLELTQELLYLKDL